MNDNKPMVVTEEELQMVKRAIMLPIILDTLEYDINLMKKANLKIAMVYIANSKQVQRHVLLEISFVKRELFKRGIKIFEKGKTPTGYQAKYLCRGYQHEMAWLSNNIKSIVVSTLCDLMRLPIELAGEN